MFHFGRTGKDRQPGDFAGLLCAHGVARAGHEPLCGDPLRLSGLSAPRHHGAGRARHAARFASAATMWSATGNCTASAPCASGSRRSIHSSASPTARFCCPSTMNTAWRCSARWTRSSRWSFTTRRKTASSPPATPIGIRPLYYGEIEGGGMAFASEPKDLVGLCDVILPFPPGCYWADGQFVRYADAAHVDQFAMVDEESCLRPAARPADRRRAKAPRRRRAHRLSCSRAGWIPRWCAPSPGANWVKPIRTFAIGMDVGRHRLKVRPAGGGVHRKRPHGGHHYQRGCAQGAARGGRTARHLRHHHHPRQRGHVPCLQVHPRAHGRARAPHRRGLRRAVRLQVHGLCPERRRLPARGGKARARTAHVRRAARRPLHLGQLPGGARALWRPRLRALRHEPSTRR